MVETVARRSHDPIAADDVADDVAADVDKSGDADRDDPRRQALRRRLEVLIGTPFTEGNSIEVLRNGDRIFPAMLEAIRGARRTVDLMTFVYWRGDIAAEFAAALAERAAAGVRVRLLVDALGGRLIDKDLVHAMERAGVCVEWFRKPLLQSPFKQNHRLHRKVLVVDEQVAFTGGVGIAEEWCGDARDQTEWRDTHVRVEGPAVDGLHAAFVQDWAESGRPLYDEADRFPVQPQRGGSTVLVVRGSASLGWDDMQSAFHVVLRSAQERLRIATAYFAPDSVFLDTLCETAQRGVRVELLVPGPHADKRVCRVAGEAQYDRLLDAGIEVFSYQPSMMHAKTMTVDGYAAVIGSSNFNRRSLDHDEENVLVVLDRDVVARLDQDLDEDLTRSRRLERSRWHERAGHRRILEAATLPVRRWL
ncbi:MAG TPA: phospholipase D-like domain-containing protein [Motilibacteraceae bacterium]|nr:phospholipase D-like domain-containing protein [Motilibacteraceae bacterium]